MRIDLHTHSSCSDGTTPPGELVREAARAGLDVVALTDHDSTAGWQQAAQTADEAGVELVRGIEISTKHEGRSVHLLGYLCDPSYRPLLRMLDRILRGRDQRVPRMVARLRSLGIDVTEQAVLAKAADSTAVGRPHVADVLVDLGVVASRDEAFADYLSPRGKGYVSRPAASLEDAIRVVAAAGGVSVVAHPWGRIGGSVLDAEELARLRDVGLTGVEVDHLDHDDERRRRLRAIAAELDLVVTGSSDYHGAGKPAHHLGVETTAPEQYERLLDAAARSAAASGRDVPAVVGRS
jgi:predicted metal-dependent phosphoesterase TrpH